MMRGLLSILLSAQGKPGESGSRAQPPASSGQKVSVECHLQGWHQLGNYSWYISFVKSLPWEQTILNTYGKRQAVHCRLVMTDWFPIVLGYPSPFFQSKALE